MKRYHSIAPPVSGIAPTHAEARQSLLNPEPLACDTGWRYLTRVGRQIGGTLPPHTRMDFRENLLLAALPQAERRRLDPLLEPITLDTDTRITVPGQRIDWVYFLRDAVTSTVQQMSDGSTIEVGLMGIEGVAGVQVWLGAQTCPTLTFVQIPGTALRMSSDNFVREVREKESPLNHLIGLYVHCFLVLTALTAACNRLHSVEERLCRWLSMTYNRAQRREFPLRHEFLADMLGVHRPTISVAAGLLQKAGLISYHYGKLTILDPQGLAEGACECYGVMEAELDKIFGQRWRTLREQSGPNSGTLSAT